MKYFTLSIFLLCASQQINAQDSSKAKRPCDKTCSDGFSIGVELTQSPLNPKLFAYNKDQWLANNGNDVYNVYKPLQVNLNLRKKFKHFSVGINFGYVPIRQKDSGSYSYRDNSNSLYQNEHYVAINQNQFYLGLGLYRQIKFGKWHLNAGFELHAWRSNKSELTENYYFRNYYGSGPQLKYDNVQRAVYHLPSMMVYGIGGLAEINYKLLPRISVGLSCRAYLNYVNHNQGYDMQYQNKVVNYYMDGSLSYANTSNTLYRFQNKAHYTMLSNLVPALRLSYEF